MPKPKHRPRRIAVKPPKQIVYAWGAYLVPPHEVEDARAYGRDLRPWVAQAQVALAMTATASGFSLLNTFWGTDEESGEQALTLALLCCEVYEESRALFTMGFPRERMVALGEGEGKHLAIATVDVEGKPPIPHAALQDLPRVGW